MFQQEMDHLNGALLSSGHDRRWFVPAAEIDAFVTELRGLCRNLADADCRALTRSRLAARAAFPPSLHAEP